jgi:hypothetical protein
MHDDVNASLPGRPGRASMRSRRRTVVLRCVACCLSCVWHFPSVPTPPQSQYRVRNAIKVFFEREHAPSHIKPPPAKSASKAHPTWRSLSGLPLQWSAVLSPLLQSFVNCTAPHWKPLSLVVWSILVCPFESMMLLPTCRLRTPLRDRAEGGRGHCFHYEAILPSIPPQASRSGAYSCQQTLVYDA